MAVPEISSGKEKPAVLLAGDINSAFPDAGGVGRDGWQVCENMLDAVEAAGKGGFGVIAVVMKGASAKLKSALTAIRRAGPQARIILLARMSEEPEAMKLVAGEYTGGKMADDYLICPLSVDKFYDLLGYSAGGDKPLYSVKDIDYDQAKIERLEELATVDELTGLKNRRYIWEFSRQIIEHAKTERARVTLLLFDIDNFKHYNDVYNHSAGDEILKQAAVLIQRSCRPHDVVGRIGGDEFAVIFWDDPKRKFSGTETERRLAQAEHPKEPIFIANRFRTELEKTELNSLGPAGKGVLTISGGLATFPRDGGTIDELFRQADKALLEAKRSGKNRIYLVGKSADDIKEIEN